MYDMLDLPWSNEEKKLKEEFRKSKQKLDEFAIEIINFKAFLDNKRNEIKNEKLYSRQTAFLEQAKRLLVESIRFKKQLTTKTCETEEVILQVHHFLKTLEAAKDIVNSVRQLEPNKDCDHSQYELQSRVKNLSRHLGMIYQTEPYRTKPFNSALYMFVGFASIMICFNLPVVGVGILVAILGVMVFKAGVEQIKPDSLNNFSEQVDEYGKKALMVKNSFKSAYAKFGLCANETKKTLPTTPEIKKLRSVTN